MRPSTSLPSLLRYVAVDYNDPDSFVGLRRALGAPSARCSIWPFRRAPSVPS